MEWRSASPIERQHKAERVIDLSELRVSQPPDTPAQLLVIDSGALLDEDERPLPQYHDLRTERRRPRRG